MCKRALFMVLCSLAGSLVARGATIEQYLWAPFPSELRVAPGGGKVVWLLNERGARNLWAATAPDYKGRRLTAYKEDDGQDVGMIQWTADGRSILYVRGGNLEQIGQANPNPQSLAQLPDQSIWIVSFDGGVLRKLADGHSPAASKDGNVAFIRRGQIWMTNLEGAKANAVVQTRGVSSNLLWSPDGSQLAFVNSRGDHSFIGVYKRGDQSVTYLDASTERDVVPVWSPDGRRIAFLRIPSPTLTGRLTGGRDAPSPWSIRMADASTGVGREVWHADRGAGSVASARHLFWADGDRLIFAWEKTGWQHLYSVAAKGGAATELTPGEFEIEDASLTEDRREILFSSNQSDIDRRHIWRVAVAGGKPAPTLGKLGDGIEWEPQDAGNGTIIYFRSSAKEIGRAAMKAANASPRDLAPDSIPADFPSSEQVVPQQAIFKAADGMTIHGQLFLPKTAGKHAALLFFHGGPTRQMLLGWHYMDAYSDFYGMNQYWANKGYVVLSVNYRGGLGYGLNFREPPNFGSNGASEYADVLAGAKYLAARADVDPKRIGVWGGSYGGYLTAMALARSSDLFAAGVDYAGVHDWSLLIAARGGLSTLDPDKVRERLRIAFDSSPMASVKKWKSPVLLIHGDDDRNVPFNQTVELAKSLREQGTEFEELIFPDDVHDLLVRQHWIVAMKAADAFFDKTLKGRE